MRKDIGEAPLQIEGWLHLVAVRLVLGIAPNGNYIYEVLKSGSDISIISFVLSAGFMVFVLIMLYKRHKAFPGVYIGLEACTIVSRIAILVVVPGDTPGGWGAAGLFVAVSFLISILWILYMLISRRVKKTFVWYWNNTVDQRLVDKANSI